MKKTTKTQKILKHMQTRKKGITSMTAFEKYKVTRLSSIIYNLKKQGHDIEVITEYTKDGTRYARYVLKEGA